MYEYKHKRDYRVVATSSLEHRDELFLESFKQEKLKSAALEVWKMMSQEERKNADKKIIGIVKPYEAIANTTDNRKKMAVYLASDVAELGKVIYRMHEFKHRLAQDAVQGHRFWGNSSDTIESMEQAVKEAADTAQKTYKIIEATGFGNEFTHRAFREIIYYLKGFAGDDFLRVYANELSKYPYPIDNKRAWKHLRKLEEAAYNTVYSMFVSREEQNATKIATDEACKAYDLQEDAMRDRKAELRRMKAVDLVALRDQYVDQGNKIPKPRYSKYGGSASEYLTSNNEEEIVNAIMKIEYPRNILLPKPDGYKEWQEEQYKARRLEEKRIKDLAWKKIKALVSYEGGYVEELHNWEVAVKIYKKMFGDRWDTHQEVCNTITEKIEEEKNPEGIASAV